MKYIHPILHGNQTSDYSFLSSLQVAYASLLKQYMTVGRSMMAVYNKTRSQVRSILHTALTLSDSDQRLSAAGEIIDHVLMLDLCDVSTLATAEELVTLFSVFAINVEHEMDFLVNVLNNVHPDMEIKSRLVPAATEMGKYASLGSAVTGFVGVVAGTALEASVTFTVTSGAFAVAGAVGGAARLGNCGS